MFSHTLIDDAALSLRQRKLLRAGLKGIPDVLGEPDSLRDAHLPNSIYVDLDHDETCRGEDRTSRVGIAPHDEEPEDCRSMTDEPKGRGGDAELGTASAIPAVPYGRVTEE